MIWQFTYHSTGDFGEQLLNSFQFVSQPPVLGDDISPHGLGVLVDSHYQTLYRACLAQQVQLDFWSVLQLPDVGDNLMDPLAAEGTINLAGTFATDESRLPREITAIIAKKTSSSRRTGRGYNAMPSPLAHQAIDNSGKWVAPYLTHLNDFAAILDDDYEYGTDIPPGSVIPVVYSRTRQRLLQAPCWHQVEAAIVRAEPRWRRSRISVP